MLAQLWNNIIIIGVFISVIIILHYINAGLNASTSSFTVDEHVFSLLLWLCVEKRDLRNTSNTQFSPW